MNSKDIKVVLTNAQNALHTANNSPTDVAVDHLCSSLGALIYVVNELVNQTPDVQAIDAAADNQTEKDSA
jgi:hypothetical protein